MQRSITSKPDQASSRRGFTIVELLIVIVVIGILAAITIVAYNGIQQRARDSNRQSAIGSIRQALEMYKLDQGRYPSATSTQSVYGGWEMSTDDPGTFMEYLAPYISRTPLDPVNSNNAGIVYWYYRYGAGGFGCDPAKGAFYVLRVQFEIAADAPPGQGPACAQQWGENYVFIQFEN
jgi:type II secretion system protein G